MKERTMVDPLATMTSTEYGKVTAALASEGMAYGKAGERVTARRAAELLTDLRNGKRI
jgi:hypothetical protein